MTEPLNTPLRAGYRAYLAFLLLLICSPIRAQFVSDLSLDAEIDASIDRGVDYLLEQVQSSAGWTPIDDYPAGYLSVQLYALLKSDVTYLHPALLKALGRLEVLPMKKVYSVAISIMAYDAVLEQMTPSDGDNSSSAFLGIRSRLTPKIVRQRMQRYVDWLVLSKVPTRGVWTYGRASRRKRPEQTAYDHSNTQFAVLALGMAARRGMRIDRSVWREVADHFVFSQQPEGPPVTAGPVFRKRPNNKNDSKKKPRQRTRVKPRPPWWRPCLANEDTLCRGWAYRQLDQSSKIKFSMTSAAQSCLLLAHRELLKSEARPETLSEVERSLRDGYAWLGSYLTRRKRLGSDTYALYSLEKVGDIGEVESFGPVRWFEAGARVLLRTQGDRGQWGKADSSASRHKTALALLYLGRASALDREYRLLRRTGQADSKDSADQDDRDDRYLVYFQSRGAFLPVPRFFRQLRYRPSKRLENMVDELIDAYDRDHHDELVAAFRTLGHSPFGRARLIGEKSIRKVVELEIDDKEVLETWCQNWRRAVDVGRRQDDSSAEWLVQGLRTFRSVPLLLKLIWAVERIGHRDAVTQLLVLMDAGDERLRRAAHAAVVFLLDVSLPFEATAGRSKRRKQLRAWRDWWEDFRKNPAQSRESQDRTEGSASATRLRTIGIGTRVANDDDAFAPIQDVELGTTGENQRDPASGCADVEFLRFETSSERLPVKALTLVDNLHPPAVLATEQTNTHHLFGIADVAVNDGIGNRLVEDETVRKLIDVEFPARQLVQNRLNDRMTVFQPTRNFVLEDFSLALKRIFHGPPILTRAPGRCHPGVARYRKRPVGLKVRKNLEHLVHRRKPSLWIFLQRALQALEHRTGNCALESHQSGRVAALLKGLEDSADRSLIVRQSRSEQIKQGDATRVDVHARPDLPAVELLGSHEVQRADDGRLQRQCGQIHDARDPEVRDHWLVFTAEQHIRGLQVAVNDTVRVQLFESGEYASNDRNRTADWQRTPASNEFVEISTSHEFLHEKRIRTIPGIQVAHDVGMFDSPEDLTLSSKPGEALLPIALVSGIVEPEDLDGHIFARGVGSIVECPKHIGERTAAELFEDSVRTDVLRRFAIGRGRLQRLHRSTKRRRHGRRESRHTIETLLDKVQARVPFFQMLGDGRQAVQRHGLLLKRPLIPKHLTRALEGFLSLVVVFHRHADISSREQNHGARISHGAVWQHFECLLQRASTRPESPCKATTRARSLMA